MTEQVFDELEACAPHIAILDDNTANQIAAGEVVERPASVVKELVENAIDANARRITVELASSGKQMIRVTDDGCGMSQEDAILSLQRHATSKIQSARDLEAVETMGFRGEALPSIASVSEMSLMTRSADAPADAPGTEVLVVGGQIVSVLEVGARPGTSIAVRNIFYNVPARLKFLKTDSTELHQVIDLVQRQALARPDIAIRLLHEDREVFASSGSGSLADVCNQVYGRQLARQLLPIDYESGMGVRVTGMLGPPETMRGSRGGQHGFVNRRFVRDRAIARALDEGYRAVQTIHGQRYPIAVLLVEISPSAVDVNVSPTKTEVRFHREREVFSAVYRAVQQTLIHQGGLSPTVKTSAVEAPESHADLPSGQTDFQPTWRDPFERKTAPDSFQSASPPGLNGAATEISDPFDDAPPAQVASGSRLESGSQRTATHIGHLDTLRDLRVLAQTRSMYILAQTDHSLVLIDQHIAHERVLYERLLKGHVSAALAVQHLVLPITLELGRREAMLVEQRLDQLARAGFLLEPFGQGSFLVRGAPAQVAQRNQVEKVLMEIIDELVEKTVSRRLVVPAEEVLITASCKMAVKAGDPLTGEEMRGLVSDLLACENPYTCPHGRPIIVEIANHDLDRKFGRI